MESPLLAGWLPDSLFDMACDGRGGGGGLKIVAVPLNETSENF
jgi:hypothetical protein